jgi:hypothetical protein
MINLWRFVTRSEASPREIFRYTVEEVKALEYLRQKKKVEQVITRRENRF